MWQCIKYLNITPNLKLILGNILYTENTIKGVFMAKIIQTAGKNRLWEFYFVHFNDDILFGKNWNNEDIDLKTRCIIAKC